MRKVLVCMLLFAALTVADEPAKKDALPYRRIENVVFAEDHGIGLLMDIFIPTQKNNGLAIIDVASGAYYSSRDKLRDHERAKMFDIFCGKGYTVFAIRPGSQTKFSLPEMLANTKKGIRWVRSHATEYKINPEKMGITGASAGGHLCSLAAVTADDGDPMAKDPIDRQSCKVKAAVAFFPPTDWLHYGAREMDAKTVKFAAKRFEKLLFPQGFANKSDAEIVEAIVKISPARQVTSSSPPFLLVHGDADLMVPLQQSKRFQEALQKAGVSAELIVKKGGGHPWPTIHEEVQVAADWFDKQLAN